jgi:hypothetical protein
MAAISAHGEHEHRYRPGGGQPRAKEPGGADPVLARCKRGGVCRCTAARLGADGGGRQRPGVVGVSYVGRSTAPER